MSKTENQVVLITGAAKRIGKTIAKLFHENGYCIAMHFHRSQTEAAALASDFNTIRNNSAAVFNADLEKTNDVAALAKAVTDYFGRVDTLVNNASSFYPTPIGSASEADWDNLIGSNVKAPFFLAQALAAELKRTRGNIINIADIYAERPKPKHTIYCIAKAGNVMLTKSMAVELAPEVRVNGIAPGAMLAPVGTEVEEPSEITNVPLNKFGGAEAIAKTAFYLATQAEYTTGQILAVDGGKSLAI